MPEAVVIFQRASGDTVFGCAVNLQRHIYAPIAKPSAAGLGLWCRDCREQHVMSWLALLLTMERFVGREAFRQVLCQALEAMPLPRTVSWRGEE